MTKRAGFTINTDLADRWRQAILNDGYGARGKSRWTSEAIVRLVEEDPTLQWVGYGSDVEVHDRVEDIRLSGDAVEAMLKAVRILRRQLPDWEGVRSDVIRTAIRWRLQDSEAATVATPMRHNLTN